MDTKERGKTQVLEAARKNFIQVLRTQYSGMSQTQLAEKCKEAGYQVSQPEISRLLAEKGTMTLYQAIAFADVLDMPLEHLLNGAGRPEGIFLGNLREAFITDPDAKEFDGLQGKYYVLFHSTGADEEKVLEGMLQIGRMPGEKVCRVRFVLDTGVCDRQGNPIRKQYEGQTVIAPAAETIYCILSSERQGEISILAFRYRSFKVRDMACRMGLVLTVSAGEQRFPAAHKLFISRDKLTGNLRDNILQMLRLSNYEFKVSERTLETIKEQYPKYVPVCNELRGKEFQRYITVNENIFWQENGAIEKKELLELLLLLKKMENIPYYLSVRRDEDRYSYFLYENR